ncbi:unnamed protein product [Linum trigynum]|uniref:Uncharacterized protein n=1 Tax=Linum trigynum TaxID=586398 RepID=A0AAV2DBF1_9ROSI
MASSRQIPLSTHTPSAEAAAPHRGSSPPLTEAPPTSSAPSQPQAPAVRDAPNASATPAPVVRDAPNASATPATSSKSSSTRLPCYLWIIFAQFFQHASQRQS